MRQVRHPHKNSSSQIVLPLCHVCPLTAEQLFATNILPQQVTDCFQTHVLSYGSPQSVCLDHYLQTKKIRGSLYGLHGQ